MRKRIVLSCLIAILAALVVFGIWRLSETAAPQGSGEPNRSIKETLPTLTVVAMGDQLAHDSILSAAKSGQSYDFTHFYTNILPYLANQDVVFCNPETLAAGPAYGIAGYPVFNAPVAYAEGLRDSSKGPGCNLINLASNHINDKGQAALDATVGTWESLKPLAFAGANRNTAEQQRVRYFTKNGIKVAFLAFADYSNNPDLTPYGLNIYHDQALVQHLVSEARQNADVVLVSMHWGTENMTQENEDQRVAAQHMADLGVDAIIGTGPHVLQPVRWLTGANGHKTLVWYSLGNTLSAQLKPDELTGGIAGFTITKTKHVVSLDKLTFRPTFMSYDWSEVDKNADNLAARSNFQLRLLKDADGDMQRMFGSTYTVTERSQFVQNALTNDAQVQILR